MPNQHAETVAVIVDGGLAGLVAAWSASACAPGGDGQPLLVVCASQDARSDRRRRAAHRLVELCAVSRVIQLQLPPDAAAVHVSEPAPDATTRRALSHLLLDAAIEAMRLGITRVIWPVHSGAATEDDLRIEAIADAADRSLLIGQLASLDAPHTGPGSRGVRIETPYADLTDLQLAELAIDAGAPLSAAWWCETDADRPCSSCPACRRWSGALAKAGGRTAAAC